MVQKKEKNKSIPFSVAHDYPKQITWTSSWLLFVLHFRKKKKSTKQFVFQISTTEGDTMYCNTHNHTVGLFFCVFFFSPRILLLLPIDNISLYGKQHTFFLLKHTLTYTLGAVAGMSLWGRKEPLPITIFITWGKWLTIYQLFLSFFHFFFPFYFKFLFTFLFCLIICKTKTGGRELVMARRHISICRHNNNKKKNIFFHSI